MLQNKTFEVIIIGGSYAGLSAALSLGRSLRRVLIIDHKKPCNAPTPHSQNFLTQDGQTPAAIAALALQQVKAYPSVEFITAEAVYAEQLGELMAVKTATGDTFYANKLILATGIQDVMPDIPGFAAAWGKTVIHCPYCHGYEFRAQSTGILANGDKAIHLAGLVHNLSQDLRIFTNGPHSFSEEQRLTLANAGIPIVEEKLIGLEHRDGLLSAVGLADGRTISLSALYGPIPFVQHSAIPEMLGCALTEAGHILVDGTQLTSVPHVYACGDNTVAMRSVSQAVATGSAAGAMVNMALIQASFGKNS